MLFAVGIMLLLITGGINLIDHFLPGIIAAFIGNSFHTVLTIGYIISSTCVIAGIASIAKHPSKDSMHDTLTLDGTNNASETVKNSELSTISSTFESSAQGDSNFTIEATGPGGPSLHYHYDCVKLAVPPDTGCFTEYDSISYGAPLYLEPEPENTYDSNAVRVMFEGKKLGYLCKGRLQEMYHDYQRREDSVTASFEFVGSSGRPQITLDFKKTSSLVPPQNYPLNCNKTQEIQETIALLDNNAEANLIYDEEKQRYCAFVDGLPIGFLPKTANSKLSYYKKATVSSITPTQTKVPKFDVTLRVEFNIPPWLT